MTDDEKQIVKALMKFFDWMFEENTNIQDFINKSLEVGLLTDMDDALVIHPGYMKFRDRLRKL
jgi:hypothetical protein